METSNNRPQEARICAPEPQLVVTLTTPDHPDRAATENPVWPPKWLRESPAQIPQVDGQTKGSGGVEPTAAQPLLPPIPPQQPPPTAASPIPPPSARSAPSVNVASETKFDLARFIAQGIAQAQFTPSTSAAPSPTVSTVPVRDLSSDERAEVDRLLTELRDGMASICRERFGAATWPAPRRPDERRHRHRRGRGRQLAA